ncbi:MAG: hypothetical protein WBL40_21835, partial [Terrimicrobiaceae bacterium]
NDGINQVIDEVSAWKIRLTGGCGGHDGGGEALGNQTSDDRALDGAADDARKTSPPTAINMAGTLKAFSAFPMVLSERR